MASSVDTEIQYSLEALHTTQYYRLRDGVLYYRTAKSDLERALPLHSIKKQRWKRYSDQYFWWGLITAMVGLIYFAQTLEREAINWNVRHIPFALAVLLGTCQAIYWARFPRVYRLISNSGDSVGIVFDGRNPARSLEFIEHVQMAIIHQAQERVSPREGPPSSLSRHESASS